MDVLQQELDFMSLEGLFQLKKFWFILWIEKPANLILPSSPLLMYDLQAESKALNVKGVFKWVFWKKEVDVSVKPNESESLDVLQK